jgi:uncharacterized protein
MPEAVPPTTDSAGSDSAHSDLGDAGAAECGAPESGEPSRVWLAPAGLVIGCMGAICGIGGGLFATPLQHYGLGVPLKRAVATSLALVFATACAATGAEALRSDSVLPWTLVLALVPTALVGAQIGFRMAQKVPTLRLKRVFTVVLLIAAARLLWTVDKADAVFTGELGFADYAMTSALGLIVGIVVPLLGIGGGLVVVPGMLLLVPQIGFPGARGVSLAAAVVTAGRSLLLFLRAGNVDPVSARLLGIGAFLGSAAGVQLVHLDGAARFGQRALAGVMLFAAYRFARDVFAFRRTNS